MAKLGKRTAAAREAFDHGPWPNMSMGERADIVRTMQRTYAARGTAPAPVDR